jgi:hypothetical protein
MQLAAVLYTHLPALSAMIAHIALAKQLDT